MGHARDITGIPRLLARPSQAIRTRLVAVVLLAFALRALIPLGFMPASDGSLSLMICPGGLPAGILQGQGTDQGTDHGIGQGVGQGVGQGTDHGISQGMGGGTHQAPSQTTSPGMGNGMPISGGMAMPAHRHDGGHGLMDEGYCTFTTGFSSAPPPLLLVVVFLLLSCVAVIAVTVLAPAGIRLVHLPQARAPPAPL